VRAEDVDAHVRKRPFRPFRMFLSDGSSHEVRHPELIIVARREIILASKSRRGRLPERYVFVDPLHVTHLARMDGKRNGDSRRRS